MFLSDPDHQPPESAAEAPRAVQMIRRIFADQLTPVLAYRRLVAPDDRTAPSFLFESVEQGGGVSRFSMVGVRPRLEVIARGDALEVLHHRPGGDESIALEGRDPFDLLRELAAAWAPIRQVGAAKPPDTFRAGFVGFAGYDTARWAEPRKLGFDSAPRDDRELPDLHMGLYGRVLVFDHVGKTVHVIATEAFADHAGLDGKATFVGLGSRFEIWNPDRYAVKAEAARAYARENKRALKLPPMGLHS